MDNDTELETLFYIATALKSTYIGDESSDPWANSPFAWIKTRPSRQVGKIGEQLVAEWCRQKEFIVSKSGDSEADLVLSGHRIEIKFSTLWGSGVYTFQQLRDQNYEYAFFRNCLGRESDKIRQKRKISENEAQSHKSHYAIFAGSGKVAADLAEVVCAHSRAKTARDFLLDFHHSQIAFSLIVIKWHIKIIHKG